MDTVSIKDFRDKLAQLVEEVAIAGKQIEITKFGKPKAMLIPINSFKNKIKKKKPIDVKKLPGFGMWKNRKDMKDPAKWVHDLRVKESTRNFGKIW